MRSEGLGEGLLERLIQRHGADGDAAAGFRAVHAWSVTEPAAFWREAWTDLGIVGDPGERTCEGEGFLGTRWFPDARLNVVDTLLAGDPGDGVVIALAEDAPRLELTRAALRAEVAACAAALRASGVGPGDRVAAWMPNVAETVVFALGALAIGAVVSTASPDFGPTALVDRFGQIEPVVLLTTAGYRYGGRWFDLTERVAEVEAALTSVREVVIVGDVSGTRRTWDDWLAPHRDAPLATVPLPFNHPGFVLFSSGTTGRPKCIVHSAAGVLLKVLSEQGYHLDVRCGDRMFYATTCGWMMWNWLLCGLGRGATIVLADGSPGYPELDRFWAMAEEEGLNFLGVSAALIDAWRQAGLTPGRDRDLGALRTMASTGSPLATSGYDWVAQAVAPDVHLASISGGTDLCGCLVLGVCTEPVVRGEIQGPALGLDVTVFREDGSEADPGEDGELVCRTPFPTVPLRFWGDDDGSRLRGAYFERFPGVWAHGDHARRTASGGFEILGRSDATLNAKGVRIGTAEIYRVVTALPGIADALAVGQQHDGDSRIVLFVVCAEGRSLDDDLVGRIRQALRTQASPRHVPALIVAAPALPRTRSNKLAELAASDIVNGRPVRDVSSLANPESLGWFRTWADEAR
jgi:acetoacetyl-CoA synthetase